MPRKFYGTSDMQHITLRSVFPLTSLSISSPLEAPREACLCVEGPKEHLLILHPHHINIV